MQIEERVAVIGLGYVGLPVAVGFARVAPTVGFDIDTSRVAELRDGHDRTGEIGRETLSNSALDVTDDPAALTDITFFVITVPTPIDGERRPNLGAVKAATRTVARALKPGAVVVYESTVWPGLTEEVCGPLLEAESGLVRGRDFFLGYSPERINPGDRKHTLERIVKVVSGEDASTLDRVAKAYGAIIEAGVHRAPTIAVAEAAKVIENTQRDLNIALMNELSLIFDRLGISTRDVLAAAGTKWNFLPFVPGLVGGHCIGVDPYYLTARAESVGYHPEVILAGRRINDGMGAHVAHRVIRWASRSGLAPATARIGIIGLTFKENVPDMRNSRVPDIVAELKGFGVEPLVADPWVDPADAQHECGVSLVPLEDLATLDALILAVAHDKVMDAGQAALLARIRPGGLIVDVKSKLDRDSIPDGLTYTAL
jgi:UDP-N-acetyl-D-galactosamine dehydrogenase